MRINNDLKLDFNDVLIRPKRSVLSSRKKVVLERNLRFKKIEKEWTGIPIIASNMDHVGTFEIAEKLNEFNMLTALHRFYSQNEFQNSSCPAASQNLILHQKLYLHHPVLHNHHPK